MWDTVKRATRSLLLSQSQSSRHKKCCANPISKGRGSGKSGEAAAARHGLHELVLTAPEQVFEVARRAAPSAASATAAIAPRHGLVPSVVFARHFSATARVYRPPRRPGTSHHSMHFRPAADNAQAPQSRRLAI